MKRFVDRQAELASLEALMEPPGAQFLMVYGRRRVGKTTLLLKWAERYPTIYWVAGRMSPAQLRRDLTATIWRSVVRELAEVKTPRVLAALPDKGDGWTVHYAFFARAGFTQAAQAEAGDLKPLLVDLDRLDRDLQAAV